MEHGPGRGLVRAHAHLRRAGICDDHARGADDLGGADDGAEVALVGNVVEHDDERVAVAGGANHVGELGVLERLGAHDDALMGTVARKLVKARSRDILDGNPTLLEPADDAVKRRVSLPGRRGDHGAFKRHTRRESLFHGATALDEVGAGSPARRLGTTAAAPLRGARGTLRRLALALPTRAAAAALRRGASLA